MSSEKVKLNWVRFFLKPRFMSYFWGHFSDKTEKIQAAIGVATTSDPEHSPVWNRAQPEDTTQMKCQCIIMIECLTLPRAVHTVAAALHQGFGREAPYPGAAAGLAREPGGARPAWATEL